MWQPQKEENSGVKVPIHHLKYTQVKVKVAYTIFKLLKKVQLLIKTT